MTYEEFLRNWFDEKNGGGEYYDTYSTEEDSPWKVGWTRTEIVHDEEEYTWIEPITDDEGYYWLTKEADGVKVSVGIENGEYGYITKISIEAAGVDVANEEIGTIDAVDALLGTGLDAASKKAEELKKRKLVTVANLQKALEDYDERKGTAVEDGEPTAGKNKVFVDGSGRVYARRTELARQSSLDSEKSERQSADNRLSAEIAKKADKEHTHKAADITDMPNYARSVNGEEPDADGDVEIDIDAVEEVAELPGETKKKVYIECLKETKVNCSSVDSMLSGLVDWLSGGEEAFSTLRGFMVFMKNLTTDKGTVNKQTSSWETNGHETVTVTFASPVFINGMKAKSFYVFHQKNASLWEKGTQIESDGEVFQITFNNEDDEFVWKAIKYMKESYDSGWIGVKVTVRRYTIVPMSPLTSLTFIEDRRTPPAVYAKSVELATKEALSEATSGADEKAAALGERIGAVESSVKTAKSDIAAMKSDITEAQANITTAQSDITKAHGDIEAVASEVEAVKTDVAALGKKVVRSVNGAVPDENGNVEVAGSSDASDKNDTITVSDTDSAISDDTGILSGESGENPKGLLRFAASKLWDYVQGKIRGVLGVDKVGDFIRLNYDVQCNEDIENPGFKVDRFGNMASKRMKQGKISFTSVGRENLPHVSFNDSLLDNKYILVFEVEIGAEYIDNPILIRSKRTDGFDIAVYTNTESKPILIRYSALPIYAM